MGGGASGKGTSQATTTQTANNKQVAAQSSGIALGGEASGNTIMISSADPEIAKASLAAGVITQGQSLQFAGHAAEVSAMVNQGAIDDLSRVAQYSVGSANDLATKFIGGVSDVNARQIGLLQSLASDNVDITQKALSIGDSSLARSYEVSKSVAPQDPSYALQTTLSKTAYLIIGIVAAVFLGFWALRKKSA